MKPVYSALVVVVLAIAGFLVANQVQAISDSYSTYAFHPFTIDSSTGGCPLWVDEESGETTRNCDPVNLIFLNATPQQVQQALGWSTCSGSTQWMHFDSSQLIAQNLHLCQYESFTLRYHVRLWQVPGAQPAATVGAVHHESGLFTHTIDKSWDDSEAFVASLLCGSYACSATGVLQQQSLMQGGDGEWRGWANNARATVIDLTAPPPPAPTATQTPLPTSTPAPSVTPTPQPEPTATPTSAPGGNDAVYVSSIAFESRLRGRGGANHDERIAVGVRRLSDGQPVSGAWVTIELRRVSDDTLVGSSIAQTNGSGEARSGWFAGLPEGTYRAEVTAVSNGLSWDREAGQPDGDGDGFPDATHAIPH